MCMSIKKEHAVYYMQGSQHLILHILACLLSEGGCEAEGLIPIAQVSKGHTICTN